jgi:hypothetical protein
MKSKLFYTIPIFIIALFFWAMTGFGQSTAETQVTLSSFVEPKQVPLNRTVKWTVRVEWKDALSLIEIEKLEEPILSNFDIVGSSASNHRLADANGQTSIKEISYTLAPKTLGMGYIEPAAISYTDKATGETHHLMTQRIGVEVVGAVAEPGEVKIPWIPILTGFVVIAAFLAGGWMRKRAKDRKASEETEVKPILEEVYLEELKSTVDLATPQKTESLTILTKLFRRYLAEKIGIPALEATTSELVQKLKESGIESRLAEKSESLFAKSDVIKFSGREATQAELDEAYTTVETVLETQLKAAQDTSDLSNEEKWLVNNE